MIRNYFTLALRNFRKHKVFSLINVLGLAVGISASLVIFLIVQYEFSFDRFHKDGDRIYRVVSNLNFAGSIFENSGVAAPLPVAIRATIPGAEAVTALHLYDNAKVLINKGNRQEPLQFKNRKNIVFVDPEYFGIFSYQWIAGSPDVLKEPNQVVLTESRAREYFTGADITKAVGQVITYNDSVIITVAGIVKDLTTSTDFTFKEFIAVATIPNSSLKGNFAWGNWDSFNASSQCFVKLKPDVSPKQTSIQITRLMSQHSDKNLGYSSDEQLQPLEDLHFNSKYDNFSQHKAHKPTLYGLLIVAAFLLMLGCINFINLTTAQASQRAKEIGIRKTMGSNKRQLVIQFLSETTMLTVAATLLSIALIPSVLKLFGDYVPAGIGFNQVFQPSFLLFIVLLIATVSLLSGFYPSWVLTQFKPVLVLKNQAWSNTGKTRNAWLRKTLTVSQFIIAQFFIIGSLTVTKQIYFSLHKDLGYNKEAIVNIQVPGNNRDAGKKEVFLHKLKAIPEIRQVCLAGKAPANGGTASSTLQFDDGKKVTEKMVEVRFADAPYFNMYQLKLVAGKMLQPADTIKREYLVNEAFAREMGYKNPAEVVGKVISDGETHDLPIAGVLADFHTKSLRQAITPLVYSALNTEFDTWHILLQPPGSNPDSWKHAIAKMEKAWKEVYTANSFDYAFFDETIAKFYRKEQSTSRLLNWASGLAIFISCLGLLGLVIFTTHQRVKEIGVRKVLGASVTQIVSLLSKEFILLVILAFIITVPLAWWAASAWLQNFSYRTTMPWWLFVTGGAIMIVLALLTLSVQTIRSALANPVKALRSE